MDRGYTIQQLSALSGVSVSAIRFYIRRGLIPRPEGNTRAARYGNEHLVRLRAITQARERNVTLDDLRDRYA